MVKRKIITTHLDLRNKIPVEKLFIPSDTKGHKKPSSPYGYFEFDGDKYVEKNYKLPEDKRELEKAVIEKFVSLFNKKGGNLTDLRQLGEQDHDFEVKNDGTPTVIQLSEISLRGIGQKSGSGYHFDGRAYHLLVNAIRGKVKKYYPKLKGKQFWLVIWQNDISIGADPESMRLVFNYLANYYSPFDKILYFHFHSNEPKGLIKEVWKSGVVLRNKWIEDI